MGELGLLGPTLPKYGAGLELHLLRADLPGARARRLRPAQLRLGPEQLCMFPIYSFGSEEQKREVPARDGQGRADRLLRADRARARLRSVRAWRRARSRTATAGSSTAPRCGSPTATWPTVPSSGRRRQDGSPRVPGRDRHARLQRREIKNKLSLRASVTSRAASSGRARAGRRACCPGAQGLGAPLRCLNEARFGIIWGAVGAAMACYESALEYAKVRAAVRASRSRLPAHPGQAGRHADRRSPRRSCWRLPARPAEGRRAAPAAAGQPGQARQRGDGAARSPAPPAACSARNGISLEHPIFRHMVNLETVFTYEGTHEIHTLVLGQDLTGHRGVQLRRPGSPETLLSRWHRPLACASQASGLCHRNGPGSDRFGQQRHSASYSTAGLLSRSSAAPGRRRGR